MKTRKISRIIADTAVILMSAALFAGCSSEKKTDETTAETENDVKTTDEPAEMNQENVYVYEADITHDGETDKIIVDLRDVIADNQLPAKVSVQNSDEEILYEEELFLPHAGWNQIYLYQHEGESYLLSYQPNNSQGFGSYTYNLYYIEAADQPVSVTTGAVQFDEYMNSDNAENFFYPEEEMVRFAEDVNAYLSESLLLVSTYGGQLTYSMPEQEIHARENYAGLLNEVVGMNFDDVTDNGIQENINLFYRYLEDEYARMTAEQGTDQTGGYDYELMAQQCADISTLPDTLARYSIGDVNQDGMPEFIVCRGTCEADYTFHIYSFDGAQLAEIGQITGGHVTNLYTYSDREGIVVWVQQMGYELFIEMIPSTGDVNTIYEGEMTTDEDMNTSTGYEQPSNYMELLSYDDITAEGIYNALSEQLE